MEHSISAFMWILGKECFHLVLFPVVSQARATTLSGTLTLCLSEDKEMKIAKSRRKKDGEEGRGRRRGGLLIPPPYSPLFLYQRGRTAKLLLPSPRLGVLSLTGSCLVAFKYCHSQDRGPDSTPGSHTRELTRNYRMDSSRRVGLGKRRDRGGGQAGEGGNSYSVLTGLFM